MNRTLPLAGMLLVLVSLPSVVRAEEADEPAPVVFVDIAGTDAAGLQKFYAKMFGWKIGEDGAFTLKVVSPLPGTIRKDPTEKRIYIGVKDVTAKLNEIKAAGGSIDVPRFVVPGVVILGLFKDPAGNPMGLVEIKDGKPIVP